MSDTVTVTVQVDPTRVTHAASAPRTTPPTHGSLPFTGVAASGLVLAAIAALAAGWWLTVTGRRADPSKGKAMRSRRLPLVLLAATVVACAAAGPALAGSSQSNNTTVTVATSSPGTRQLSVLDMTGQPLTNLTLRSNTPQPFRVVVADNGINDLTTGFTVSAVMNNLYQKSGSSYTWGQKIPSSDVSINYNPLSAFGVSFSDLPKILATGSIPSCATLASLDPTNLGGLLTNPAATQLCGLLGTVLNAGGLSVPSADSLDIPAALASITPAVSNLANLPFAISGNQAGAFNNPDFANGIGASDPGATATTPTAYNVMQGTPGMSATLQSEIQSALSSLNSLPLTSATGSGAQTSLSDALAALSSSSVSALQQLSSGLAALGSTSQEVEILNNLTGSLIAPVLADVSNVVGTYNAFPLLTASVPGTASAGTYQGTLTITLVQQ